MIDKNKIEFCNPKDSRLNKIENLLIKELGIERSELPEGELYEYFRNNYNNPILLDPTISKNSLVQTFVKLSDSEYQGIDFPTLFSSGKNEKGTIVIISEDPLRKHKDNEISIGTPYALHRKKFRDQTQRGLFNLIESLVSDGYTIYLTDVYKLYIKKDNQTKYRFQESEIAIFKSILKKELDIINPSLVITFGNPSRDALSSMEIGFDSHDFIHPSGAANKSWKKLEEFTDIQCTDKNKYAFIYKNIKSKCA